MALAANILFQFILLMNAHIAAKRLFALLSAAIEVAFDIIQKCVKSIVITPIITIALLFLIRIMFLRTGTKAVCFSRYNSWRITHLVSFGTTGCCNCLVRKPAIHVDRELRGTSSDGRGTIYFTQNRQSRKESKEISCKNISSKRLNNLTVKYSVIIRSLSSRAIRQETQKKKYSHRAAVSEFKYFLEIFLESIKFGP